MGSAIRSVITRVIAKSDDHDAGVRFIITNTITDRHRATRSPITKNHKYYNFEGLFVENVIEGFEFSSIFFDWISQQSDYNCPIKYKSPINDLIGEFIDQSSPRKL